MTNNLKSGVSRVDARLLLKMLVYIHQQQGATLAEICETIDVSRATANRMIANARQQYGADIIYQRKTGNYVVTCWGVFDKNRVIAFMQSA